MKVFVYPEKTTEDFGAERWVCEWQELKTDAPDPNTSDDFDPDMHLVTRLTGHKTKDSALKAAHKIVERAYYGACVYKQVVDWFVEEDRIAEWVTVGEPEYL